MRKSKAYAKANKKQSAGKKQNPESPDEFQEAADFEEETGGKWRAGDAAKSGRAFLRAIDIYNNGLARYPTNFDLAYNKARLEFDLSQQSSLVAKLPIPLLQLLQQALVSHRYALSLDQDSADTLFNAAQVMISLAETLGENPNRNIQTSSVPLLQEALEFLNVCYTRQEDLLGEQSRQIENDNTEADDDGGVSLDATGDDQMQIAASPEDEAQQMEQYVTIQNPITPMDLLDTAKASLAALTLLVSLDAPSNLSTLASVAQTLTDTKIPQCISRLGPEKQNTAQVEADLARSSFIADLASAEYSASTITAQDYLSRLSVFETLDQTSSIPNICSYADALVDYSTAMLQSQEQDSDPTSASTLWKTLTHAQTLYKTALTLTPVAATSPVASTSTPPLDKAQIYTTLADMELLRYRLTLRTNTSSTSTSGLTEAQINSAPTLLKNVGTYARGAGTMAKNIGDEEAVLEARVREIVVAYIVTSRAGANQNVQIGKSEMRDLGNRGREIVEGMVDEGVVEEEQVAGLF